MSGLLEHLALYFVQQDRKEHLQHVADNDKSQIVQNCIAQQQQQLTGGKEKREVFQPNKRTVKNSKAVIVLDEGNVHAWHGHIAKDKEEG